MFVKSKIMYGKKKMKTGGMTNPNVGTMNMATPKAMKTGGMVNPNIKSMGDVAKEALMKAKKGREIPRGY